MDKKGKYKIEERSALQAVAFVSSIGIQFAIIIGICIFIGKQVDNYLNLSSWGTLCGIILGFFVGIWITYKKLLGK